jgi:hypothetical protein
MRVVRRLRQALAGALARSLTLRVAQSGATRQSSFPRQGRTLGRRHCPDVSTLRFPCVCPVPERLVDDR